MIYLVQEFEMMMMIWKYRSNPLQISYPLAQNIVEVRQNYYCQWKTTENFEKFWNIITSFSLNPVAKQEIKINLKIFSMI